MAETLAAPEWQRERDTVHFAKGGKGHNMKSLTMSVMTAGTDGARLKFSCQVTEDGLYSLASGFEVDPSKAGAAPPKRNITPQKRTIRLTIDNTETPVTALYNAHTTRLMPASKTVAKQLFNAIVLNQTLSFDMQGKVFAVAHPGVDPVFEAFAQECPVSNGGVVSETVLERVKNYSHPVLGK